VQGQGRYNRYLDPQAAERAKRAARLLWEARGAGEITSWPEPFARVFQRHDLQLAWDELTPLLFYARPVHVTAEDLIFALVENEPAAVEAKLTELNELKVFNDAMKSRREHKTSRLVAN